MLKRAKSLPVTDLINEIVLRSQAQAVYAAENVGHFGLHLARYAHFTSPIRRYADLIVHRALIRALQLGPGGLTDEEAARLPEIAQSISEAERRAMAAERETIDRLVAAFLADRVGAEFAARISGVTRAGLFVRLKETGADGFVPAATIGNDYYRHHEDAARPGRRPHGRDLPAGRRRQRAPGRGHPARRRAALRDAVARASASPATSARCRAAARFRGHRRRGRDDARRGSTSAIAAAA